MKHLMILGFALAFAPLQGQGLDVISLEELNDVIERPSEKIRILNFWASWCGPCVKEMPEFDSFGKRTDVDLYFVSLDFLSSRDRAEKLLKSKGILSTAYLLNERDSDKYISQISETWSGAIPATLFISPAGQKIFHEKVLNAEELEEIVSNLIRK